MIHQSVKQIWSQRTLNVWLWLELVVVFVCLSYLVDYLYTTATVYFSPVGYNIEHVYSVSLAKISPNSDAYVNAEADSTNVEHLFTILERIRAYPGLESACVTLQAPPYNQRMGNGNRGIDTTWVHGMLFQVTPEFFRVFRVADKQGQIDPLVEAARQERTVIATVKVEQEFAEKGITALHGELKNWNAETPYATIRAISGAFRYTEFSKPCPAYYQCLSEAATFKQRGTRTDFAIRVHPDVDTPEFIREFRNTMKTQLRLGNIYLLDVLSFKDIRTAYFRGTGNINNVKTHVAGLLFLLVNILLGVIGTFWIRTQQRRSEVALRMVLGASKHTIRKYLIAEGLLLLFMAALPASIVCGNIVSLELLDAMESNPFTAGRFLMGQLLTLLLMSFMIMAGIYFPSRQAMKIQPSEALHEE